MSGHGPHLASGGDRKALVITGVITGAYFVVELGIGLWSGSVAVTSDAFHTFSAVGGVLIALVAQRLGERPASFTLTFGWGRAEIVGALFNGLFLAVMGLYVLWMGGMRLREPLELPTGVMLWAAAGGLVTEAISFWLLYQHQKTDLNIKGAFWHVLQTFVGSLIIIVSAVVVRLTGFERIDPLLGMAFGLVLFMASGSIIRSALNVLLQGTPTDFDVDAALSDLRGIPGVRDLHHIHVWSITSGRNVFSGHIRVEDYAADGRRVLLEATRRLDQDYKVYFSTLQIEDNRLGSETDATDIDITAISS